MPGTAAMTAKQGPIIAKPASWSRRCPIRSIRAIASAYQGTAATAKMASWRATLAADEACREIRPRICGVEMVLLQ